MDDAQIPEASALVLWIRCIVTWSSDGEPQWFVDARISCSITTFSRDPQ
jgi:hypothetical protein